MDRKPTETDIEGQRAHELLCDCTDSDTTMSVWYHFVVFFFIGMFEYPRVVPYHLREYWAARTYILMSLKSKVMNCR